MELRGFYKQAAEAAAPAVRAEEDDEVPASSKGSGSSPLGLGNNAEAGSSSDRGLRCPECGKAFLSDKAMYGHLRSHPERGYKGASRPATACSPTAAVAGVKKPARKVLRMEAGELPATDMSATPPAAGEKKQRAEDDWTPKWPVTAKRGRASSTTPSLAGSAPAAAAQLRSWRSPEEEAAMILLEMGSGSRTASGTQQQSRQPVVRTRDAKHQTPEVDDEQPMLLDDHVAQNQTPELPQLMTPDRVMAHQTPEAGQQIVQLEPSPEAEELTGQLEIPTDAVVSTPPNQQPATPAGSGARKRKKRRVPDSEHTPAGPASTEAANVKPPARRLPSPASDRRHECPICAKSFSTHQALGGHMTGHNKGRRGARHVDPAVVQAAQSTLAHHKRSRNAVTGRTGAAEDAVAGAGQAGAVGGARVQEGAVAGADQAGAIGGGVQKGAVADAGQQGAVGGARVVQEGPIAGAGQEGSVGGSVQEGPAIASAAQERHYVQPPAQHACPACNKTFRTGQALGGHKKKHWHPEKQQAKTALAAASRSFDLNELPSDAEGGSQP